MSFDMRAKPFDLDDNAVRWVNDTFNAMTQEEKIAQLFVDMLWNDTGKQTAALLGRYPSGGLRYNNASWLDERRMTYMAIQAPEGTKDLLPDGDRVLFRLRFKLRGSVQSGDIIEISFADAVFAASDEKDSLASVKNTLKTRSGRVVIGD